MPHSPESLFDAARQLTGAQRSDFLTSQCGDDAVLRARVDALLDADGRHGDLLDAVATTCMPDNFEADYVGREIGNYRLLQTIGEGGFGVVFMAEQQQPVQRRVAIKVIKPGMDTRAVVARFEAERQALALMQHPNIASVFDGGEIDGRPYFVMELVRGVPITEYCDANALSTRDRLALFVDLCNAVQHAHGKGIIHRDIKPANVMVTLHDGRPVVKVIDFGVAKAIHTRLTERTMFTAFGQMLGTPLYMSPEQAEMSGLDIDIRTDVYSMGVLLYELVTGVAPLTAAELQQASFVEMQRLIREQEAVPPSQKLSTTGRQLINIAGHRGVSPEHLIRTVRGDLDWVVMKALDKDRRRRYETVREFSADVESLLSGDAVIARPPSPWYRLTKFVRRYRVASLVALILLVAAAVSTTGFVWALRAEAQGRRRLTALNRSHQQLDQAGREQERLRLAAEDSARTARQQEQRARLTAQQADSLRMAAEASRFVESDPALSVTLATRAREAAVTADSYHNSILLAALANHHEQRSIDLRAADEPAFQAGTPRHLLDLGGGRVLATFQDSDIGAVAINTETGEELFRLPLSRLDFDLVALSPDRRLAATVSDAARYVTYADGLRHSYTGRAIRLWNLQNGQELRVLTGHDDRVQSVEFSQDGRRLISASLDGTVRVWDVQTGEQQQQLSVSPASSLPRPAILSAALSPDQSRVLAVVTECVMTAGYGARRGGFEDDPLLRRDAAVVTDELSGSFRVQPTTEAHTNVVVWNCDDSQVVWMSDPLPETSVVAGFITMAGQPQVAVVADQQTHLFDGSGKLSQTLSTDQFLATRGDDDRQPVIAHGRLRRVGAMAELSDYICAFRGHRSPPAGRGSSALHRTLTCADDEVTWRSPKESVVLRGHRSRVRDALLLSQPGGRSRGQRIVSLDDSAVLKVWQIGGRPALPVRLRLPGQSGVELGALFGADQRVVAAALYQPRRVDGRMLCQPTDLLEAVDVWNPQTGERQRLSPEPQFAKPEGLLGRLAGLLNDQPGRRMNGGLTLFEVDPTGRKLLTVHKDLHLVARLQPPQQSDPAYTPVRIWDLATGDVQTALQGFRNTVTDATFSSDGQLLATVESDRFHMATADGGHSEGNNRLVYGGIDVWRDNGEHVTRLVELTEQPSFVEIQWHPSQPHLLCRYRIRSGTFQIVFDALTGAELLRRPAGTPPVRFAPTHPLLTEWHGSEVHLTDVRDPAQPVHVFSAPADIVAHAFATDGRLALISRDGTLQVRAIDDGRSLLETKVSFNTSCQVQFSADGRWLLVMERFTDDVTILSLESGREWLRIAGRRVQQAAFSPDSESVLVVSADRVAELWPLDPLQTAAHRPGRPLTAKERRQLVRASDPLAAEARP